MADEQRPEACYFPRISTNGVVITLDTMKKEGHILQPLKSVDDLGPATIHAEVGMNGIRVNLQDEELFTRKYAVQNPSRAEFFQVVSNYLRDTNKVLVEVDQLESNSTRERWHIGGRMYQLK